MVDGDIPGVWVVKGEENTNTNYYCTGGGYNRRTTKSLFNDWIHYNDVLWQDWYGKERCVGSGGESTTVLRKNKSFWAPFCFPDPKWPIFCSIWSIITTQLESWKEWIHPSDQYLTLVFSILKYPWCGTAIVLICVEFSIGKGRE